MEKYKPLPGTIAAQFEECAAASRHLFGLLCRDLAPAIELYLRARMWVLRVVFHG